MNRMADKSDAATPALKRLEDYAPPPWLVEKTELVFRLHPTATRVKSRLRIVPNPAVRERRPLRLDGVDLALVAAQIDDRPLRQTEIRPVEEGIEIAPELLPEGPFTFAAEVEINPSANTALEGLYLSNGIYCTQCEAEGFRKITFYPDRPDVMARFTVRIEGEAPVLLSNGNPVSAGAGWAVWDDPWPKPSYLFALVAGDLVVTSRPFTTRSGRPVTLNVWTRPGDEDKAGYALDALERAMRWDERRYGREYDLDVFNIVAIDDFNMGAMENKGLNIFNAKYVLARPEIATDSDFELIEGIVAHEYFHNWTGNRITCRDWFQLSLKEGLTVYRDRQFTSEMRSAAVKRIEDVRLLRERQFREDAGPLAHPVRPRAYAEINNFYTATVYEKGAEVIAMLHRLVGEEGWRKALELYFERHDGDAATIEDWLRVFEDATGRDLSHFALWYEQAGTPRLEMREEWDEAAGRFTLHFRQWTPPTPGQPEKKPLVLPIAVGLLDASGAEVMPTRVLEMTEAEQSFSFEGLAARPIPSVLRGFSAPVILEQETTPERQAFLLAHDTDPFNRWEAGNALALDILEAMATGGGQVGPVYLDAVARLALDDALDPAFRALVLTPPSEEEIAQRLQEKGHVPDPEAIHTARRDFERAVARHMADELARLREKMKTPGPYSPDAASAGRRALANTALRLLALVDEGAAARAAFAEAGNMTDELAALTALQRIGRGERELQRFADKWRHERLVMDKWFALQAAHAPASQAVERVRALAARPDFDWKNPNRFRALLGSFAMRNPAGFHRADGAGYALVADWLIRLDPVNPQTAARVATAFETWTRHDAVRRAKARAALERIAATQGLSRDLAEVVGRILAAGGATQGDAN